MCKLSVVFMGTPDFATEILKTIHEANYEIKAVVTTPDKPSGRGLKLTESSIKQYAVSQNLKILQPEKLKNPEFIQSLRQLNADCFIVVAFRMLPKEVWSLPQRGTFNLHASLLPDYRGAAPINHVIINGEQKTGVTTFFINDDIDTGDILLREEINILPSENAGSLHDKLMVSGAQLVLKTLDGISSGNLKPIPQFLISNGTKLNPAPKIFKQDCLIDWNQSANVIFNKIRGLSPYPCAYTELTNENNEVLSLKIYETEIIHSHETCAYGTIISDRKSYFMIKTEDGFISIKDLHLSGKKRLKIEEFLKGFRFELNWKIKV
jgi:methionyl-tRNA formyltransferase